MELQNISVKLEVDTSEFEQKLETLREKVADLTGETVIVYVDGFPTNEQREKIRSLVRSELPMLKRIAVLPSDLRVMLLPSQA